MTFHAKNVLYRLYVFERNSVTEPFEQLALLFVKNI